MFRANSKALEILHKCFNLVNAEWKWYNLFKHNKIISTERILLNAARYLITQSEVILSVEDN